MVRRRHVWGSRSCESQGEAVHTWAIDDAFKAVGTWRLASFMDHSSGCYLSLPPTFLEEVTGIAAAVSLKHEKANTW